MHVVDEFPRADPFRIVDGIEIAVMQTGTGAVSPVDHHILTGLRRIGPQTEIVAHSGGHIFGIRKSCIGVHGPGGDDRVGGIDFKLGDFRISPEIVRMIGRSLAADRGLSAGHAVGQVGQVRLVRDRLIGVHRRILHGQCADGFGFERGDPVMLSGCDAVKNTAQNGIFDVGRIRQNRDLRPCVQRGIDRAGNQIACRRFCHFMLLLCK